MPSSGSFFGLVTAANADAPPILQWDGLAGYPRNPVSWYFYAGGSRAQEWDLSPGWAKVTAAFLSPTRWQVPDQFSHHGETVFFAIAGYRDTRSAQSGLAIFPENLKNALHGIRSVVEAHSKKGEIQSPECGTANGLAFQKGSSEQVTLRIRTAHGTQTHTLDRWD